MGGRLEGTVKVGLEPGVNYRGSRWVRGAVLGAKKGVFAGVRMDFADLTNGFCGGVLRSFTVEKYGYGETRCF